MRRSKSGRQRQVPLRPMLVDVLREQLDTHRKGHVFLDDGGEPLTSPRASQALRKVIAKARVANFRAHDLRHHFATMLRRAGHDLDEIAALLGHTTIAMTTRYAHVGRDQLRRAVEAAQLGAGS